MKKYLHLVQDLTTYNSFKSSNDYIEPNITYVKEEHHCQFNPIDYSNEYLTIVSKADNNTIGWKIYSSYSLNSYNLKTISVSTDNGQTWTDLIASKDGTTLATLNNGDKLLIKGNNTAYAYGTDNYYNYFTSTQNFDVSGNIMSLIYGDNFIGETSLSEKTYAFSHLFCYTELVNAQNLILPATTLSDYCYSNMFEGCTSLTSAPKLPATTLANSCYAHMFEYCRLSIAPELPATTLANNCYYEMFRGCTLSIAPELPATTLASYCYAYMFRGCTSLTTAPELPVTTLANGCYYSMFQDCTGLTSAPELPATTLAISCYENMFYRCSSLTSTPELSATTLADNCYKYMFYGCSSLTIVPELPAITLANYCYQAMFDECTALTIAPELPATTLANYCYQAMFAGCTLLTSAPKLPATTLVNGCYYSMFVGCTSLITAPELPATILANNCYYQMFSSCSSLNYIKCLATDISATDCTTSWVNGVAATGKFVKHSNMNSWTRGNNGIPQLWSVKNDYSLMYLTIVPTENGTISFSQSGLQYSTDKVNWTSWDGSSLSVTSGTNVYLKGNMTPEYEGIGTFSSSNNFNVEGNAMSILYGDNFIGQTNLSGKPYAFYNLFSGCTHLVNAENLALPATTLASYCYQTMFAGCTSLTTTPELPATTLANECYSNMFQGCTSLITAPELPATILANECYSNMFKGCTSLTIAPELPATTLANECYYLMFYGCTNLNYIKCLATDISADNCTSDWVNGVAATGTFGKNPDMSSWTTGIDGIPNGWTVENDYSLMYLTIVPTENGTISFSQSGLQYSTDKTNWSNLGTSTLSIASGTNVYLKGAMTPTSSAGIGMFNSSNSFNVKGNAMSLLYGDNFIGQTNLRGKTYAFYNLFSDCTHLVSAEHLVLPATTLASYCYANMFQGCTSLTIAPTLPATTLQQYCYNSMFRDCSSLTTAPVLPAPILTKYCYQYMFYNCRALNYIKCLATDKYATSCVGYWVYNVAATGTFVKNSNMSDWSGGVHSIPSGWTVQDATN